jgi:hypothetical protein
MQPHDGQLELFQYEPQWPDPDCAHGKPFEVFCDACAAWLLHG